MSDHLRVMEQFLKERKALTDIPETGFPFVTISRESGAGGHYLSNVLMSEFAKDKSDLFRGWHVFDKLICEVVAEDPALSHSMKDLVKEHYVSEFEEIMNDLIAGVSSHYLLHKKTFQVIGMLAAIGKVIIVGRGGCCITSQMRTGIHIRLVAPEAMRQANTMKSLKVSRDEALRTMHDQDGERRKMVKRFFCRDLADPTLYDAVWNTGRADTQDISTSIMHLIKRRSVRVKD